MKCPEDPKTLLGQPIGQFHCPFCGCMQIAGLEHMCDPESCLLEDCDDCRRDAFRLQAGTPGPSRT